LIHLVKYLPEAEWEHKGPVVLHRHYIAAERAAPCLQKERERSINKALDAEIGSYGSTAETEENMTVFYGI
jgi:hypothetical protein